MDLTAPESTLPQALTGPVPPTGAPPQTPTFPHGTHEGVATAPSQMPSAGQGLYGIRPHPDAAHLFAIKGQFICIYATQQHQITATQARTSQSRYVWSTNATNRQNRKALYFDAANAPHYGKYLNDMWNAHGNNCELKCQNLTYPHGTHEGMALLHPRCPPLDKVSMESAHIQMWPIYLPKKTNSSASTRLNSTKSLLHRRAHPNPATCGA